MILLNFAYGLAFEILGLAAYFQWRREGDFPLKKELPWLAAFGFVGGAAGWVEMFIASGSLNDLLDTLNLLRVVFHLLTGAFLLRFGWGIFKNLTPLPAWMIFIPGVMVVPIAFIISYAATTFITPSPIEIPIEIWTRYLLYLPGAFLAGMGFIRQWWLYKRRNMQVISRLMLGAGIAFIFEGIVLGLIVPAAPFGPATYYNYDRVLYNAFSGENGAPLESSLIFPWFGYDRVKTSTGLSIDSWRLLSLLFLTYLMTKALDIFETIRKEQIILLETERDKAQRFTIETQIEARRNFENWTNSLMAINRRIGELKNVDELLSYIIGQTQSLLKLSIASVGLIAEQEGPVHLKCYGTLDDEPKIVTHQVVLKNGLIDEVIKTGKQIIINDDLDRSRLDGLSYPLAKPLVSCAIIPLKLDNTIIGIFLVGDVESHAFTGRELFILESITDQIAISIEHALMTTQLQSFSIIQERGRIAREMHDGIAQVLGYLNLQVQTLTSLHQQEKHEELTSELRSMREAIKTANADVRENILSLRTTLGLDTNLVNAIREYLEEFGLQTGISTKFNQAGDDQIRLPSVSEVQLVCIMQEALTNVRKHSGATSVSINLAEHTDSQNRSLVMTITDNGLGFDQKRKHRHFGLQTMMERAEAVGGTFSLHSSPGAGTKIECQIPFTNQPKSNGILSINPKVES